MSDPRHEALTGAIVRHREFVRRQWRDAHKSDPEYEDITHLCVPSCAAAILEHLPQSQAERDGEALAGLSAFAHPYPWEVTRHPTEGPYLFTARTWGPNGPVRRGGGSTIEAAVKKAMGNSDD